MGCIISIFRQRTDNSQPSTTNNSKFQRIRSNHLASSYRYPSPLSEDEWKKLQDDFWSSRVEGNALMWQAAHSACEALLQQDVEMANAILEASSLGSLDGRIQDLYDERGFCYNIPPFCFQRPKNLIKGSVSSKSKIASSPSAIRELRIKVRISPDDRTIFITIASNTTISQLKQRIFDETCEAGSNITTCPVELQRVMFMGKELLDNLPLEQAGVDENRIVQVFRRYQKK